MPLNEFTELVKQIRLESPGLTYREAQIRAKLRFEQGKEKKTTDTVAAPGIATPQFTVPGVNKQATDPVNQPFDVVEVEKLFRSGNGIMHIRTVMYNYLRDYNPQMIEDGKKGSITYYHIECQGVRIPVDPNEYLRF
jgi:hypothetical protein